MIQDDRDRLKALRTIHYHLEADMTSPAISVNVVDCLLGTAHYLETHSQIPVLSAHVFRSLPHETKGYCPLATA